MQQFRVGSLTKSSGKWRIQVPTSFLLCQFEQVLDSLFASLLISFLSSPIIWSICPSTIYKSFHHLSEHPPLPRNLRYNMSLSTLFHATTTSLFSIIIFGTTTVYVQRSLSLHARINEGDCFASFQPVSCKMTWESHQDDWVVASEDLHTTTNIRWSFSNLPTMKKRVWIPLLRRWNRPRSRH